MQPPAESDNRLRLLNLKRNKYILAIGRFVPEKGFHDLINAFRTTAFNDDYKLVIVGETDHPDKYSRGLRMLALENKMIVLTGPLYGAYLSELYSHAALFVLPSYHEGLPISLLEAMSYGLSCIASDIAPNRACGLSEDRFFSAGDVRGLSKKLIEFADKPFVAEDRNRQLQLIQDKYNWGMVADKTYEVYQKVCS